MTLTKATILMMSMLIPAVAESAPLEPVSTGGIGALHHLLSRLETHRRLLVIGAHPDDEDTSILTLVSRGMGGEAAYLSLSRGEGGQNLIGAELGEDLGLLRAQELLSARGVDGTRQFFSRAFDFGYTRSLDETLGFWPREVLLEDAVRVVRRFRPQILVSVFPANARAGHGQHQAAGITAPALLEAAADPLRFSDQIEAGVAPWQVSSFYRASYFRPSPTSQVVSTGGIEAASGRSLFQLSMASRSMHRSQGFGVPQPIGPRDVRLDWVSGPRTESDPFEPFDTRLQGIATTLEEGTARDRLEATLDSVAADVREAREALSPSNMAASAVPLLRALGSLSDAIEGVESSGLSAAAVSTPLALLREKRHLAEEAIGVASGWVLDATTEAPVLVAGEGSRVEVGFYNSSADPVTVIPRLESTVRGIDTGVGGEGVTVEPGALGSWHFDLSVSVDAEPSIPYFLRRPRLGELYDWQGVDEDLRGEPFDPPVLSASFDVRVGDQTVNLSREVVHRFRDQAIGEVRRSLRIVPMIEISVSPALIVWPLSQGEVKELQINLSKHVSRALEGTIEVTVPRSWAAVEDVAFALAEGESSASFSASLARPEGARGASDAVSVRAVVDGKSFDHSYPLVDYPHIRAVARPRGASAEIRSLDLDLPELTSVAYVRGASDRVPESLIEVGLPLTLLTARELAELDDAALQSLQAIVIGSRAYEADPDLRELNPRLLRYVEAGGLLLVQYQQYQFSRGQLAPFALEISRPHDRITDQGAPVEILEPAHPALTHPHRIGADDWEGWVQERGLYFANNWDDAYSPLLRMTDPEMPPQDGGLLVAAIGEGTYVYTGLSFFRQFPAGVPGAYRLFMNLLALAE